jgi:uncharacterized protein
MSVETAAALVDFVSANPDVSSVQFDLHGGEPLAVGKKHFADICKVLRSLNTRGKGVSIALQTNATLISESWIDMLERFDVAVGVSLDGPQSVNDRARVDHAGRGTYNRTRAGLDLLVEARDSGRIPSLGVLSVLQPQSTPNATLRHLVEECQVDLIDFLLPDVTYEDQLDIEGLSTQLEELVDGWIALDSASVRVRMLDSVASLLLGGRSTMIGFGGEAPVAFTVNVDGSLSPDDTLRACGSDVIDTDFSLWNTSLAGFLDSPIMQEIRHHIGNPPSDCQPCEWLSVCGGSHLVHRYSSERPNRFDGKSVLCSSLKRLYRRVGAQLISAGYRDQVAQALRPAPVAESSAR